MKNITKNSPGEHTFAFQLKAFRIPEPEREYKFHPTRKWRFDFAWIDRKIAVEIEGGTRYKSRHTSAKGFENDCEKYNAAAIDGWIVLRYTTQQILSGKAILQVKEVIRGD
jgi:very-short-patch-repair endonuclease